MRSDPAGEMRPNRLGAPQFVAIPKKSAFIVHDNLESGI
jgi:hypothetical protein